MSFYIELHSTPSWKRVCSMFVFLLNAISQIVTPSTADHCSCPPTPANGRVTGCPGSTVTYHCNSGYALSGSSQRLCQSGGRWSGRAPTCIRVGRYKCD